MLLAHALFKAALFLVVGIIDHDAGTRDLRELSGLGAGPGRCSWSRCSPPRRWPGVPPLLGFVAKEAVFGGVHRPAGARSPAWSPGRCSPSPTAPASSGARSPPGRASQPVRAGAARRVDARPPGPARRGRAGRRPGRRRAGRPARARTPNCSAGVDEHLALWHGLTPALGLSALALAGGGRAASRVRGPLAPVLARLPLAGQRQPGVRVGHPPLRPAGHRGHRRDPAGLAAAVPRHHPARPGAGARRGDARHQPVAGPDRRSGTARCNWWSCW